MIQPAAGSVAGDTAPWAESSDSALIRATEIDDFLNHLSVSWKTVYPSGEQIGERFIQRSTETKESPAVEGGRSTVFVADNTEPSVFWTTGYDRGAKQVTVELWWSNFNDDDEDVQHEADAKPCPSIENWTQATLELIPEVLRSRHRTEDTPGWRHHRFGSSSVPGMQRDRSPTLEQLKVARRIRDTLVASQAASSDAEPHKQPVGAETLKAAES